jgi:hypothetical protein
MIIGIALGIALAVSITSVLIIATSTTGILKENIATGAVIGTKTATPLAIITLGISLTVVLFLITILRKPKPQTL